MEKTIRFILIVLFVLCGRQDLFAQQRNVPRLSGTIVDSLTLEPLAGATVEIAMPSDTLFIATDKKGKFNHALPKDQTTWPIRVRITYVGYKPLNFLFRDVASVIPLAIRLAPASHLIDNVTVKGRIAMITQKGDTLEYNPRAIRSQDGDNVRELLKSFPGVEIGDNDIKVNGQQVEVVYVNGKMVFGSDVMDPLKYIDASDVDKIRLYAEETKLRRRKRTVMDILTFSKMEGTVAGEALVSAGPDLKRDVEGNYRMRYGAGGSFNIFAEKNILKLSALTSNIDRKSSMMSDIINFSKGLPKPGTYTNTDIAASYERNNAGKGMHLKVDYLYGRNTEKNKKITQDIYYPSAQWASRTALDTLLNENRNTKHTAGVEYSSYLGKKQRFSLNFHARGALEDNRNDERLFSFSELDSRTLFRQNQSTDDRKKGKSLDGNLSFGYTAPPASGRKNSRSIFLNASYMISENDISKNTIDTLTSSTAKTYVISGGEGRINNVSAGIRYMEPLSKYFSMAFGYTFARDHSKTDRVALDNLTGEIDSTLTERYVDNRLTHMADAGLNYKKGKLGVNFSLRFQSAAIEKNSHFPVARSYGHNRYNHFLPQANISYYHSAYRIFSLTYSTSVIYPSADKLSNTLDAYNPYRLVVGNPHLQPARQHAIQYSYNMNFPTRSSSLQTQLTAKITTDKIASRMEYLLQDTLLAAYGNYRADAGANLVSALNVGTDYNIDARVTYSFLCRPIKSIVSLTPSFSFFHTPTYIGTSYNVSDLYYPAFTIGLRTNFSRVLRLTLSSSTTYAYTENDVTRNVRAVAEQAAALATLQLSNRWYVYANYLYRYYKNLTYSDSRNSYHQLNAALGCKVFRNKVGEVCIAVYDILNGSTAFTAAVQSDRIRNTWTYNYGRYITLNFSYRFNKQKNATQDNKLIRMLQ